MKKTIISAVILAVGIFITAKTYVPILACSPDTTETYYQVSKIGSY